MKTNNTLLKAEIVQSIVAENYEPGRHDRCKRWVYRTIIKKRLPMSECTFFRLLHTDTSAVTTGTTVADTRQLSLFD